MNETAPDEPRSKLEWIADAALLRAEDPAALGLCRILIVSILTLSLLAHVGAVGDYFSSESMLAGKHARAAFPSRWSLFFYVGDPTFVRLVFALGVASHLMWVVGLFTPVAAGLSVLLWVSMVGRSPLLYSLPDQLQISLAFLLALMPTGRGLSLDARRRGCRPVPVWCRRMIQLQMAVVYTGTGLLKSGKTWGWEGTALFYALQNPYNRHFVMPELWASLQPWVLRPSTWAVHVWEIAFGPFVVVHWLWESLRPRVRVPDLRLLFLGFGVAMHIVIQILLYVVWFTPLCVATYVAFMDPQQVRRIIDRWKSRVVVRLKRTG